MKLPIIGIILGEESGGNPRLCARLLAEGISGFSPVIIGSEPIFSSALSRICPELIDAYPIKDIKCGLVVRNEPNRDSGRLTIDSFLAAASLFRRGLIDALLILPINAEAVLLANPDMKDIETLLAMSFGCGSITTRRVKCTVPADAASGRCDSESSPVPSVSSILLYDGISPSHGSFFAVSPEFYHPENDSDSLCCLRAAIDTLLRKL